MASVSGTVKDSTGAFAQRLVRAYRRDTGVLVGATLSNPSTGAWSIATADTSEHFALVHDGIADPYWDKVVLAMHMDGANGATTFTDLKGNTITKTGTVQISTAQSVFGGASCNFNGGYLNTPLSTSFDLFSGDCCIRFRLMVTSVANSPHIISIGTAETNRVTLYLGGGQLLLFTKTSSNYGTRITGPILSTDVFYDIELDKSAGIFTLFVNGTSYGTSNTTIYPTGSLQASLGWQMYGGLSGDYLYGYIDDLTLTKGAARNTAAFTPPSTAFMEGLSGGAQNALVLDRLIPL